MLRGEVWLINLHPTVGAEIRKTRPAVIVSEDAIGILPLRVVVPLTEWRDPYEIAPWLVRVQPDEDNNLDEPSAADALQIRSVSRTRFVSRLGQVTTADLESIVGAVQVVVGAS